MYTPCNPRSGLCKGMVLTEYGSYVDGPYEVWSVRRWSLRRMVRTSMVLTEYGPYVDGPYGVCLLRRMVLAAFAHYVDGPYGEWSLRWIVRTVNGPNDIITTDLTNSGFSGFRVTQSLVFCVAFYRSLFVLFFVSHCIFDVRLLINPLLSSNFSHTRLIKIPMRVA